MHDATIRFEKRTPLFSCNMQIGSSKTQPRFKQMLSVKRSKEADLQSDSNYDDKEVIESGYHSSCNCSLVAIWV